MKVLLLGLGRANIYVAQYLLERDYELYLYEENWNGLSEDAKSLLAEGKVKEYKDGDYEFVVSSPGFPDSKPIIQDLHKRGIEVIDEIEFTYNNLKNPRIIAVTGTNGKSTTAAMINSILNTAGINNFLGGNIAPGKPFSSVLFQEPYEYYVLEVSSFQLMRIKNFRPHIAILTNIAIDHLNWHRDMNEYISAKKKIFMNQTNDDYALLNYDDERVRIISEELNSKKIFFGRNCYEGAWLDGMLHFHSEEIVSSEEIPLIGEHNRFNALAAIAAGKVLKISNDAIKNGLKNFKPLVHRLEDLGIIDGIRYINNSMSTNEASAIASFKAVVGNKIVIVGGRKKGDRCENYLRLLIKEAKAVVLLGENAEEIGQFFKENQYKNFAIAENMDDAISKAKGYAQQGDIIMLNPGFASFGHFRDFQERGEAFKNGVLKS